MIEEKVLLNCWGGHWIVFASFALIVQICLRWTLMAEVFTWLIDIILIKWRKDGVIVWSIRLIKS